MQVDWIFEPGKEMNWTIAFKHQRPPEHLVALIEEPSDGHFRDIARVLKISQGVRKHKLDGTEERCLLFYLILSSADHGWWAAPMTGINYRHGFHPPPVIFYRYPATDYASQMAAAEGWGPKQFLDRATNIRLNGVRDDCAIEQAKRSVLTDYRALFREDLLLHPPSNFFVG